MSLKRITRYFVMSQMGELGKTFGAKNTPRNTNLRFFDKASYFYTNASQFISQLIYNHVFLPLNVKIINLKKMNGIDEKRVVKFNHYSKKYVNTFHKQAVTRMHLSAFQSIPSMKKMSLNSSCSHISCFIQYKLLNAFFGNWPKNYNFNFPHS